MPARNTIREYVHLLIIMYIIVMPEGLGWSKFFDNAAINCVKIEQDALIDFKI